MEAPTMDPVQQHIFEQLHPHRCTMFDGDILALTSNIAFLIKYNAGVDVKPSAVVVSIIKFKEEDGWEMGVSMERITVSMHAGPRHFTVVLKLELERRFNSPSTICTLEKKVTKAVKYVLDKCEGEGSGE